MSEKCILCGKIKSQGKCVVKDPTQIMIMELVNKLNSLEREFSDYNEVIEYVSSLTDDQQQLIRYHRSCRQLVMKRKGRRKSGDSNDDPGLCSPPDKKGRPSKEATSQIDEHHCGVQKQLQNIKRKSACLHPSFANGKAKINFIVVTPITGVRSSSISNKQHRTMQCVQH